MLPFFACETFEAFGEVETNDIGDQKTFLGNFD